MIAVGVGEGVVMMAGAAVENGGCGGWLFDR